MTRTDSSTTYVHSVAKALHGWADDVQLDVAAAAHAARTPAYLDKYAGDHSNSQLSNIVDYANTHAGLVGGLAAYRRAYPHSREISADLLDMLVPLNEAAVVDLGKAYSEFGTFRLRDELRDRNPLIAGELLQVAS